MIEQFLRVYRVRLGMRSPDLARLLYFARRNNPSKITYQPIAHIHMSLGRDNRSYSQYMSQHAGYLAVDDFMDRNGREPIP